MTSFIISARGGHLNPRSVEHPLIVEVLRDVGGERKLVQQKSNSDKNPFNILVPSEATIVMDEDASDDSQVTSNPIIDRILQYLGAKYEVEDEGGSVAAVMDLGHGGIATTRNNTIAQSIATAKREEANEMSSRDFRKEWDKAINVPIQQISQRISRMKVDGRPIEVYPRVGPDNEQRFHSTLSEIDEKYDQHLTKSEDVKKMPAIKKWIDQHCVILPYSISIQRCNDDQCCGSFRSPVENGVRDLVLQRQPTPILDTTNSNRKDHFLRRSEAIRLVGTNKKAVSDLKDLPSMKTEKKKAAEKKKTKSDRDTAISNKLDLRSWEAKKVRGVTNCYFCNKPRCIFSREKESDDYRNAAVEWQRMLESVDYRYSCGDLLFDDDHPVSNIMAQRQSLTCESLIEKSYYNHPERSLKLVDICIHCGDEGGREYLFGQDELEEQNKTNGKQCYPICKPCLDGGKPVVHYAKRKVNQSQKRKEVRAIKITADSNKKAKKKK